MTVVRDLHEDYGAVFEERGERALPRHFGRPARTQRAVRNAVGVTEHAYGVLVVTGEDRHDFVDNVVTNAVPETDGQGVYALLLEPEGGIRTDMYVYAAGDRLLCFLPLETADAVVAEWRDSIFLADIEIAEATDDFAVFGVHGPEATEKVASVLHGAGAPDARLSFTRGEIYEHGVTVIRTDAAVGEEGYEIVVDADGASDVLETLITRGLNAPPFGTRVWEALTLEAGTPLYPHDMAGRVPNVLGLRNALDFEKGCYVGQEIVSKVENRGRPSKRLVGLRFDGDADDVPAVADPLDVRVDGRTVGEATRAAWSDALDAPIALALVPYDSDAETATIATDDGERDADVVDLPFLVGSDRSARAPRYE
ncbi:CAF17-like 4Fe-4S cluster assembly/insertion protein YgfZ [Halarchaeum nitratireducens]|uniref:Glycine cleavage system protein T n=1 Tax=Halarchaeum nitratireducens TaxID=489913 RepID=A0A830G7A5_9EURY|nr:MULTISPECIES: aminomethyl transferase family protein [Halarchaeum]MBP2251187.1 aminomethyltransferase [Halarchaeum solikamskense]GGN06558.1 glycine cleavage system protein T [Halarchaeum nitratireducens]